MLKFKGEMLEDIHREKCGDDGHVILQHRSSFWCVISHGLNWQKIFRRPFQNKVSEILWTSLGTAQSGLSEGMRRGKLKNIMEHGPVPLSLLSSFSLPTCVVIADCCYCKQPVFPGPSRSGWDDSKEAAVAFEENTTNTELAAQCRRQSCQGFNLPSSHRRFFAAATTKVPGSRTVREEGMWEKVLIAGQYLMLLVKYSGRENGVFLQPPLLFRFLKLNLSGFPVWETLAN